MPRTRPVKTVIILNGPRRRRGRRRRLHVAISVVFALLLVVPLTVLLGAGQPLQQPLVRAPSNVLTTVLNDQYEAALAKWNSLYITDYEETVHVLTNDTYYGKWRLRVHINYDDLLARTVTHVERLQDPWSQHPDNPLADLGADDVFIESLTVSNQFEAAAYQIERWQSGNASRVVVSSPVALPLRIEYDPILGYPRSFAMYLTAMSDTSYLPGVGETGIDELKILKWRAR